MPKRDIKIKYNSKSKFLKNQENSVNTQNTNENMPESIYSPNFEQYPMWPYETRENFNNTPYEQMPDMNMPSYMPPYNQPAYNRPNYDQPNCNRPECNQPAYNQPNYNQPMYNRPSYNQPTYEQPYCQQPYNYSPGYQSPIIRNPYVPVGRERISSGYSRTTQGHDKELMRQLYKDINKALYPIVMEVLNEYEYDGSPIYQEEIDQETIAQLIDRVLKRAAETSDDVQEVMLSEQNPHACEYMYEWNSQNLLNAAIEALLLNEIFGTRRPNYRRVRNRYNYNNGIYDGINYY